MNTIRINEIEREVRQATIMLTASENWAHSWTNQPEYFKKVLLLEADMEKQLRDYLRNLSHKAVAAIDWSQYHQDVKAIQASDAPDKLDAYDVKVIFNSQDFQDQQNSEGDLGSFIKEIYLNGIALGFAGERSRAFSLDKAVPMTVQSPITDAIQAAYNTHETQLAEWLNKTTANQIVQSIQESIALGESNDLAAHRLRGIIDDPKRAMRIAQTETVRAYSLGENRFAVRNGAATKTWEAFAGADDGSNQKPCVDNDGYEAPANDTFPSSDEFPPAHPLCRCKCTYSYPPGTVPQDMDV
jgi:hypothetical protein